jgi:hypothetical protein
MNGDTLLLVHAGATIFMAGLIWFVQVVHYPLFGRVGAEGYEAYQTGHMDRTTRVVGPPMLVEFAASAALLWLAPAAVPSILPWIGMILLIVIWISTGLVQAPTHGKLVAGWNPSLGAKLVTSNWVRTIAWSLRAVLALVMIAAVM